MIYFYQDILLAAINIFLLTFLVGYMTYHQRFTHGGNLLLALIIMLSTAGISDMIFRWNPNPTLILLADSFNVFCFLFTLTILLHFSLFSFTRSVLLRENKFYLLLYFPPVILSFLYALTPLMISGIIHNPFGFRLVYNPGYWLIIGTGLTLGITILALEIGILQKKISPNENNQALLSLMVLFLLFYFYNSNLILPFFSRALNLVSPFPTTLAIALLTYEFIKFNFYALEKI